MNVLFTKFKHLVLQLKQCEVQKEDDHIILSILSKLGQDYSFFVSIFHTRKLKTPNWKIPTLNAFINSLTIEHDTLVLMGIIESSKYQALFVGGPKATNGKGNKNNQKTKFDSPKKKEKIQQHDEPSNSRKNKNKGRQNK